MTTATAARTKEQYLAAREEFRTLRREKGVSKAASQWCEKPFAAWLESLAKGADLTTEADRQALVVAMSIDLDVRDALIISMLNDPQAHRLDTLLFVATRTAHSDETGKLVHQLMRDGFDDTQQPDQTRVEIMTDILMRMGEDIAAAGASPILLAQPLATLAYVQWWNGREADARAAITLALDADPACTFAATTLTLINAGIQPQASQN